MEIQVKTFQELGTKELHDILQLRSAVFVVEQNCAYQDIDGKDEKALHVIGRKDGKIIAYSRIFNKGDYVSEASIGRVVVLESERRHNYGREIMEASIKAVEEHFKQTVIHVSAQLYLERFYNSLGFEQIGQGYLEDGIPHIGMIRK